MNKIDSDKIIGILKGHNIEKIYIIDTFSLPPVSYVMDISLLSIQKMTGDVFLCSENMDWGIICDHEGTITICSKWLVQEIKDIC